RGQLAAGTHGVPRGRRSAARLRIPVVSQPASDEYRQRPAAGRHSRRHSPARRSGLAAPPKIIRHMSSKHTWLWLTVAAVLFAFIFLFERYRPHPPTGPFYLLPDLDVQTVRSMDIWPVGPSEIRVERTNHVWHLVKPVAYAAQGTNIDRLLTTLKSLTVAHRIPEREFRKTPKVAADY